jgi:hypothetical protein
VIDSPTKIKLLPFSRNLLHAMNLKGLYSLRFFGYAKVFFEKVGSFILGDNIFAEVFLKTHFNGAFVTT